MEMSQIGILETSTMSRGQYMYERLTHLLWAERGMGVEVQ